MKISKTILAFLVTLTFVLGVFVSQSQAAIDPEINLIGKTSTAEASLVGWEPIKANDGDVNTRWRASGSYPDWWKVDLGSNYDLSQADIYWPSDTYYYRYRILASTDDVTYTTLVDKSSNSIKQSMSSDNLSGTGKYLKIEITSTSMHKRASSSINEVKLYGRPVAVPGFSFAVFGDNRPDSSSTNFTMPVAFQKIISSLVGYTPRPNFAISIGDYTYLSSNDSETTMRARYNAFMTELNKLTAVVAPAYMAVGNHEIIENATASKVYKEYFADTSKYGKSADLYYSYDYQDTHFIVLNTGSVGKISYIGEDNASNSAQANWLVSDLRANTKPWVVVTVHYPLYDSKPAKPYGTSPYTEREALNTLFDKYGVDLVQQGDVHYYRRHTEANGITYLTQGQAGASPKTSTGSDYNIACHTGDICYGTNNSSGAGYTIMKNNGAGGLTGTSYQVNTTSGVATVLDTFTVNQVTNKYAAARVAKDVPVESTWDKVENFFTDILSSIGNFFENVFSVF